MENAYSIAPISAQKTHSSFRGNRFDMLRIWFPSTAVEAIDESAEWPKGLHDIKPYGPETVLRISGKALGPRYADLLNRETICDALDNLSPYVSLDVDMVLSEGTVTLVHVTEDVKVSDPSRVIPYFRSLPGPSKYFINGWSATSISFTNGAKSKERRDRLAIYNKAVEIKRKPVQGVNPMQFEDTIRFEYELRRKELICDRLGIPDNSLLSVLGSEEPVIPNCLRRLFGDRSPPPPPSTARELWDFWAVEGAKAMFDGEPERAIAYLKSLGFDTRTYEKKLRQRWSDGQDTLGEITSVLESK